MSHNTNELLRSKQELLLTRDELNRIRMSLSWRATHPLELPGQDSFKLPWQDSSARIGDPGLDQEICSFN